MPNIYIGALAALAPFLTAAVIHLIDHLTDGHLIASIERDHP